MGPLITLRFIIILTTCARSAATIILDHDIIPPSNVTNSDTIRKNRFLSYAYLAVVIANEDHQIVKGCLVLRLDTSCNAFHKTIRISKKEHTQHTLERGNKEVDDWYRELVMAKKAGGDWG
jgi:hypothetical protein